MNHLGNVNVNFLGKFTHSSEPQSNAKIALKITGLTSIFGSLRPVKQNKTLS